MVRFVVWSVGGSFVIQSSFGFGRARVVWSSFGRYSVVVRLFGGPLVVAHSLFGRRVVVRNMGRVG